MKGDVRGFGRKRANGPDVRDRCGKLILTAMNESDAAILALVSRLLFNTCTRPGNQRLLLYNYMRQQVKDVENFPEMYDPDRVEE